MQRIKNLTALSLAAVAILVSGCGGQTTFLAPNETFNSITPVGSPVQIAFPGSYTDAKLVNGHIVVCGLFPSAPGVSIDGVVTYFPSQEGLHIISPLQIAGDFVYGYGQAVTMQEQTEWFSWNIQSHQMGGTPPPEAISPDGTKIAYNGEYLQFGPQGMSTVLILDTTKEVVTTLLVDDTKNPTAYVLANDGSGVFGFSQQGSASRTPGPLYRFTAAGAMQSTPIVGTAAYPYVEVFSMNTQGTIVGAVSAGTAANSPSVAALWPAGSGKPVLLGLPKANSVSSASIITPDNLVCGRSGSDAIVWPNALTSPNNAIDFSEKFAKVGAGPIQQIFSFDSVTKNFLALVSVPHASATFQAFTAK